MDFLRLKTAWLYLKNEDSRHPSHTSIFGIVISPYSPFAKLLPPMLDHRFYKTLASHSLSHAATHILFMNNFWATAARSTAIKEIRFLIYPRNVTFFAVMMISIFEDNAFGITRVWNKKPCNQDSKP